MPTIRDSQTAITLGRAGGRARHNALTAKEREEIARRAGQAGKGVTRSGRPKKLQVAA